MHRLKPRCSAKDHKFLKSPGQKPELLEEESGLCEFRTQEQLSLLWWKAVNVEPADSSKQGVFSAALLCYCQRGGFPPFLSNVSFLPIQNNVKRLPDFQDGSDGNAEIAP